MRILIIRHGEPDYSIDSLTEKGWREAALLSERLIKLNIKDFYCSPLGRAKDTARDTLKKFGKEATILPWLAEFRGKIAPYGKRQKTIPWDLPPHEWESFTDFYNKDNWHKTPILKGNSSEIYEETKKGVDELLASYGYNRKSSMVFECENNDDTTIAIFCHFALGTAIVAHLTGISPAVMWHNFFMPPSAVTTLVSSEVRKGEISFRCMQFGDTSHLYAGGEPNSPSGLMPEVYDPESPRNID